QFALILRRRCADLGGDGLGLPAVELKRALELLVFPSGGMLALATNPHVGSTAAFSNCSLLGDESAIKARSLARNNFHDLHELPPCLAYSLRKYTTITPGSTTATFWPKKPTRAREHRRSAAPFRRFRCSMSRRWDVALARFCCLWCIVLPAA